MFFSRNIIIKKNQNQKKSKIKIFILFFYCVAPELIATPTFSTSPNAVTIFWEEPAEKNGIILLYTIYRAIIGGTFSVLDSIAADNGELQYTDNNVKPFMTYQYYIEASNSAGFNRGNSSSILTQQAGMLTTSNYYKCVIYPLYKSLHLHVHMCIVVGGLL